MELNEGILSLKCTEGKLTRDTEFFGKMSPYCTITFGKNKYKTKIASNQGKNPKWPNEFQLNVSSPTEELMLRVWDQDMTTSDAVGFCKIKMSSLIINMGTDDWYTILFDNKPAGTIHIVSSFAPKGGDKYAEMQEKYEE